MLESKTPLLVDSLRRQDDRKIAKFSPPPTIMDRQTYDLVQMPGLNQAMDHTMSRSGKMTLHRALKQPLQDVVKIKAKQEAVKEVAQDDKLRAKLEQFVDDAESDEGNMYRHLLRTYSLDTRNNNDRNLYKAFKGSRSFLKFLAAESQGLHASSPYLQEQIVKIQAISDTDSHDWVESTLYLTPSGLKTKKTMPPFMPGIRFFATDIKPIPIAAPAIGLTTLGLGIDTLAAYNSGVNISFGATEQFFGIGVMMNFMTAEMMMQMSRNFDHRMFVGPLSARFVGDPTIKTAIDSYGAIDELLALADYKDSIKGPTVLPEVFDADHHSFTARGLRNPLMAITNKNYVPNDVDLKDIRLTFITGPNSGGKTSICKSIAQAQVLAQIGSYIPAESAHISVADRVLYHAPMVNSLEDDEGRFGVEIARAAEIFYQTTPRSLVILDELIEATTSEEKLKHSDDIMRDFKLIGNNTVLVTHNHQLARAYADRQIGQNLMVLFEGQKATHQIVPGISTESHSDEVLERLGFTNEDRRKHLAAKGYI